MNNGQTQITCAILRDALLRIPVVLNRFPFHIVAGSCPGRQDITFRRLETRIL
jgi:hypothetical protein